MRFPFFLCVLVLLLTAFSQTQANISRPNNFFSLPLAEQGFLKSLNLDQEREGEETENIAPKSPALYLEEFEILTKDGYADFHRYDLPEDGFEEINSAPMREVVIPPQREILSDITESNYEFYVYTNEKVESFIKMYTQKRRRMLIIGMKRSAQYFRFIHQVFKKNNIPVDLAYLALVESNMNPKAVSWAGASGLWQFMAPTGRSYGLKVNHFQDERFDPILSTHAAASYLKDLYKEFGNWEHALAAYNSGSGTVRKAIRRNLRAGKPTDYWNLKLPRETRGYVPALMAIAIIYRNTEKYDLTLPVEYAKHPNPHKTVSIPGSVSLKQVASRFKVNYLALKELNPSLIHGITPASQKNYPLRFPESLALNLSDVTKLKKEKQIMRIKYRVRNGDTLWSISKKYRVLLKDLKRFNPKLANSKYLSINATVFIPMKPGQKTTTKPSIKRVTKGSSYRHRVRKGENLWVIAQTYGVSIKKLMRINKLNSYSAKRLQVGAWLRFAD